MTRTTETTVFYIGSFLVKWSKLKLLIVRDLDYRAQRVNLLAAKARRQSTTCWVYTESRLLTAMPTVYDPEDLRSGGGGVYTFELRIWDVDFPTFLKKSWKICRDAFLRFSKRKSCIRCIFASDAKMQLSLVIALSKCWRACISSQ